MPIDLNGLDFGQFLVILLAISAVDFVTGVIAAIRPPNTFEWKYVAQVLDTHILKRVVPISVPAFISLTFPPGSTHDVLWTTALGLLALYVAETVASATGNVTGNQEPKTVGE